MNNLEKYIVSHSSPRQEALDWVERQTHLRTNYPRMLAGFEVGKLLETVSSMLQPMRVLELGTFTGYSSICLASALPSGARLDAVEINDELQDLIREGWKRAGVEDRIRLIIGDSKEVMPRLGESYDLVYMDANKREYPDYLRIIMGDSGNAPLVHSGSWIIADNVLWDGKVCEEHPKSDAQTQGIIAFNDAVAADPRLENYILPLRDGWNVIRVK